jgi:antitoxin VapB
VGFHVRNSETERLTRYLARLAGTGLTEAVHAAVTNEIARLEKKRPLEERIADLQESVAKRIKDPAPLTKEFYDSLYD